MDNAHHPNTTIDVRSLNIMLPNLLGIDRRIAYAKKEISQGLSNNPYPEPNKPNSSYFIKIYFNIFLPATPGPS